MNGSMGMGIGILGIVSFIVSFAKEVIIILLMIKVIQVLNIFIKKKEVPFIKTKSEDSIINNSNKEIKE